MISSFVSIRVDATKDNRYSLSDNTISYLEDEDKMNNRLFLKIYLQGNLPAELQYFRKALEDKLKEFKEYTGSRIEYEFIDPNQGTESEQQELFETLYAKGKGLLPMDIMYSKDGELSQLMIWPGAIMEYEGSTVNTIQFLPGTIPNKPFRLGEMNEIIQNFYQQS